MSTKNIEKPEDRRLRRRMVRRHDQALILAIETLGLYANPTSYHAVAFIADRPAGWFADDFSHDKNYGRWMPGKQARKTLARIQKLVTPNDPSSAIGRENPNA
jgi:hypothetical protein